MCSAYDQPVAHGGALQQASPKARNGTGLTGRALLPMVGCSDSHQAEKVMVHAPRADFV